MPSLPPLGRLDARALQTGPPVRDVGGLFDLLRDLGGLLGGGSGEPEEVVLTQHEVNLANYQKELKEWEDKLEDLTPQYDLRSETYETRNREIERVQRQIESLKALIRRKIEEQSGYGD